MTACLLETVRLGKTYHEGRLSTPVLRELNFTVAAEQLTAVIGKSGSGKSTLLHLLGTLDRPTSGQIMYGGADLTAMSPARQARYRNRELGFVYQFHHLLADFSALENVMMPLLIAGQSRQAAARAARDFLERVDLGGRADFLPAEMSGGERQRCAIARALCPGPKLILADEPTGNLDRRNAAAVFTLFETLARQQRAAVVLVTHDPALAARCDRVWELQDGQIHAR